MAKAVARVGEGPVCLLFGPQEQALGQIYLAFRVLLPSRIIYT